VVVSWEVARVVEVSEAATALAKTATAVV